MCAKPSRRLTLQDAVDAWKRRLAGHLQHHIAANLGVNQGRVSEILTGKRFTEARRLALSPLTASRTFRLAFLDPYGTDRALKSGFTLRSRISTSTCAIPP